MTTTTFSSGTVVASAWLNDANTTVYKSFVNVKTYGALGDDSTDDTTVIAAAITAISAAGGGELFFPEGSYVVSSGLTLPANCTIRGGNPRATIIRTTSLTGDVLTLSGNSASVYGISFTCNSQRTSGRYIALTATCRANIIEDFLMTNAFIGIEVGVAAAGTVLTHINRGEIYNNKAVTGVGIKVSGGNDTYISNVFVQGIAGALTEPLAAFEIAHSGAVCMYNCGGLFAGRPLLLDPTTGQAITWCFLHSCAFDSSASQGISIAPSGTGSVRGVTFVDSWSASNSERGVYIDPGATGTVDGVEFIGCRILNNQKQGASTLGSAINVRFLDCTVSGNSAVGVGTHPGLEFGASVTKWSVQNCKIGSAYSFSPLHNYGISVGVTNDNYIITGNTLIGNNTAGILDNSSATATVRVVANNLGYVNYAFGTSTSNTDGSGDITITHGMSGTPTSITVQTNSVAAVVAANAHTIGATTFKVRFYNVAAAGAALTSFAIGNVGWTASFK